MTLTHLFIATCLVSTTFAAIGPTADLTISNGIFSPDGFERQAVLVNGQSPAPLIRANKGDEFSLNVINSLTNQTELLSTSIHWHGFFQKNNSWADGVAFVTQCPIAPNNSFLYTFPTGDQAGTYWYHSHHETQYCDGLRGPLVVYDPNDPHAGLYDVDDDTTVITLSDWYHTPAANIVGAAMSVATLINGRGRSSSSNNTSPLSVITVTQNTRYRMRMVSISCDPNFIFQIDGHTMTIIEVDGVSVEQLTVDSIQIFAGQRYSFVLNANQTVDNYWIRTTPNSGLIGFTGGTNSAILRYVGAAAVDPNTTQSTSVNPMVETNLHPLVPTPVPGQPFSGGANNVTNLQISAAAGKFAFNGVSYAEDRTDPVLLQILSGARTAQELLPAGSVFTLPANAVVELSIPGGSTGNPHPIHLHGHNFFVVRSAGNSTYNYDNPVIRDVVNTGTSINDNVTIRFVTDNAGPWILHCHIDFHLKAGLALVFAEDAPTLATETQPAAWHDLCPIYTALPPADQ